MKSISILTGPALVALGLCGCDRISTATSGTKPTLNVIHLETHVTVPPAVDPVTTRHAATPAPKKGATPCR